MSVLLAVQPNEQRRSRAAQPGLDPLQVLDRPDQPRRAAVPQDKGRDIGVGRESHANAKAGAATTAGARTIVLIEPPRRRGRLEGLTLGGQAFTRRLRHLRLGLSSPRPNPGSYTRSLALRPEWSSYAYDVSFDSCADRSSFGTSGPRSSRRGEAAARRSRSVDRHRGRG